MHELFQAFDKFQQVRRVQGELEDRTTHTGLQSSEKDFFVCESDKSRRRCLTEDFFEVASKLRVRRATA